VAEKTITLDDLRELKNEGADVEISRKPMTIEQFGDLIKAVQQMVDNEQERIRADLARNQTNLEILAALQSMVKKQSEDLRKVLAAQPKTIDLTPFAEIVAEVQAMRAPTEPQSYDFTFERDRQGFASKIRATPVEPTRH